VLDGLLKIGAAARETVRKCLHLKWFNLACLPHWSECGVRKTTMPDYSHIYFNKTPSPLRLIGARGGRAYGRNQRARRALLPPSPAAPRLPVATGESTAEAVAVLDARFPWLSEWGGPHKSK
jgi:hypothetical protein